MDYLLCSGRFAGNANCRAPVLVVLDLGLPDVGGLPVLRRLRHESRQPYVPVVVFTSSTGDFRTLMDQVAIYWLTINVLPRRANR